MCVWVSAVNVHQAFNTAISAISEYIVRREQVKDSTLYGALT